MTTPSEEDIAEASNVYIGGYSYEVNASEKAALEAAGYTVETV
jgi:arylamine N-acetyltransferase